MEIRDFFAKKPNEAEVEAIANRNLFEAAVALTLKYSATNSAALLDASRLLRGHCDEQIRKADKTKKTTHYNVIQRWWRKLSGLETLERELELERNRSIQTVRIIAEQLKHLGTTVVEKKDFYGACLLKAMDMQNAAMGQTNKGNKAFFTAVSLSIAQMAQRFAPEKTPEPDAPNQFLVET